MKKSSILYLFYVTSLIFFSIINILFTCSKDPQILNISTNLDYALSFLFIIDYIVQFKMAKNKKKFVIKNWIDLLACIPMPFFKGFYFVRLLRLLKLFNSISLFREAFYKHLKKNITLLAVMQIIVFLFMFSFLLFYFEPANNRNLLDIFLSSVDRMISAGIYLKYMPSNITTVVLSYFEIVTCRALFGVIVVGVVALMLENDSKKRQKIVNKELDV